MCITIKGMESCIVLSLFDEKIEFKLHHLSDTHSYKVITEQFDFIPFLIITVTFCIVNGLKQNNDLLFKYSLFAGIIHQ